MDLGERVAVLEARMDRDDDDRESRRRELDVQLQGIRLAIEKQSTEMARYKGVVGGISLAISILWAGLAFFKDAFHEWVQR